ncbi:MAG: hypothetical protein R3325_04145 [Thermoanaerobaculia bacterium]|nr:hypothetical protein [Thermoanaerobaculia bacterium]
MDVERRRGLVALVWGFAEATLFFVVPDVLLSFYAARDRRSALRACFWAFAGAVTGGVVLWTLGRVEPAAVERVLRGVPQVDAAAIARVHGEIERLGPTAVALGPLSATPYKIYAAAAGASGVALGWLLLASVPARLGRFLLVTAVAGWLFAGPLARLSPGRRALLLTGFWIAVYALLWALVWG